MTGSDRQHLQAGTLKEEVYHPRSFSFCWLFAQETWRLWGLVELQGRGSLSAWTTHLLRESHALADQEHPKRTAACPDTSVWGAVCDSPSAVTLTQGLPTLRLALLHSSAPLPPSTLASSVSPALLFFGMNCGLLTWGCIWLHAKCCPQGHVPGERVRCFCGLPQGPGAPQGVMSFSSKRFTFNVLFLI